MSWRYQFKYEDYIYSCTSSVILVASDFKPKQPITATLIRVPDVYASLSILLEHFGNMQEKKKEDWKRKERNSFMPKEHFYSSILPIQIVHGFTRWRLLRLRFRLCRVGRRSEQWIYRSRSKYYTKPWSWRIRESYTVLHSPKQF